MCLDKLGLEKVETWAKMGSAHTRGSSESKFRPSEGRWVGLWFYVWALSMLVGPKIQIILFPILSNLFYRDFYLLVVFLFKLFDLQNHIFLTFKLS